MPEVIVKYKTQKALQDFAKAFDMEIEQANDTKPLTNAEKYKHLPIQFAENPDANSLSDIWKDNPVKLNELRKKAWGDRL